VFFTIHICTINLLLLFDNTTGMTHLKEYKLQCERQLLHNDDLV